MSTGDAINSSHILALKSLGVDKIIVKKKPVIIFYSTGIEISEKINPDIVVNIQGDEPKIDPNIIDSLILLFNDSSVEMASVASTNLTGDDLTNPNIVKVYLDDNNYALNFERNISLQDQQYFRHIGIYAYRSEILKKYTNLAPTDSEKKFKLEQLRALDNDIAIKILITNFQHRSIDIKDDLKYYEI